jgi:hypothetical protein
VKKVATTLLSAACVLGLASLAFAGSVPTLNELVMNDNGADDMEFVEICWEANQDLSAFTFVQIESDANSSSRGVILTAINTTGLVGPSGFYTLGDVPCVDQAFSSGELQNGAGTFILCRNFTGADGQDLDADNDGVADGPFPGTIVDIIATGRVSQGDTPYYGATMISDTGLDGTDDFDPAGLARCQDCDGDWGVVCLAGSDTGVPTCDLNAPTWNVTHATPCEANACGTISVDQTSWGKVKSNYR